MADSENSDELSSVDSDLEDTQSDFGCLVVWTSNSGDNKKSHLLHVDSAGITWMLNAKKPDAIRRLLEMISEKPAETAAIMKSDLNAYHLPRERLIGVNYIEKLNQLTIQYDTMYGKSKKQKIAFGDGNEQRMIFEGIHKYLNGSLSEEDADAWSVMKGPLIGLAVTGFFGGLLFVVSTEADPNYEATGRRRGLKQLFNWVGYTVGPTWISIIAGAIALGIFGYMMVSLVNRPQRKVLGF